MTINYWLYGKWKIEKNNKTEYKYFINQPEFERFETIYNVSIDLKKTKSCFMESCKLDKSDVSHFREDLEQLTIINYSTLFDDSSHNPTFWNLYSRKNRIFDITTMGLLNRYGIEYKENYQNKNPKLVIKSDYKSEKLLSKYDSFINKCINTNEKMAITNIYNSNHKELALEMINKCKLYVNRAYIDSMKKILKNPKNGFTIEHLFFGNCLNPDNDLKEPLSKFKRDIFHQFVIGNKDYVDLPLSNNNR